MTQRRLFLLTDGRPGYVEVAQYRDLEVRQKTVQNAFNRDLKTAGIFHQGTILFISVGREGVLGSLPAPANPEPEAACSRPKGGVRGQFKNGD